MKFLLLPLFLFLISCQENIVIDSCYQKPDETSIWKVSSAEPLKLLNTQNNKEERTSLDGFIKTKCP